MTVLSLRHALKNFRRSERGGASIEFGLVAVLFFLVVFSAFDFARLAASLVATEKAAQLATRLAVVRPFACNFANSEDEPLIHRRGPSSLEPQFGTACRAFEGTCFAEPEVACSGGVDNATAAEIWDRIDVLLSSDAQIDTALDFSYRFDSNLGFLGGPYTPMVTVTVTPPEFQFVSPLGLLIQALNGNADVISQTVTQRSSSVSMPGEDLALGDAG